MMFFFLKFKWPQIEQKFQLINTFLLGQRRTGNDSSIKKTTKDNFVPERHPRRRRDPGETDAPGPDQWLPTCPSASSSG